MSAGRVLSTVAASAAVAGCAIVVIGMAAAARPPKVAADDRSPIGATRTARPATVSGTSVPSSGPSPSVSIAAPGPSSRPASAAVTSHGAPTAAATRPAATPTVAPGTTAAVAPATHRAVVAQPDARPASAHRAAPAARPARTQAARATVRGSSLPLPFNTYRSTRVITVRAYSHGSTTAGLQAWSKAAGGGWVRHGDPVTAHVGADGIGTASESTSKTPAGAFTLTQAFGHYSDPGTALPYLHTTSADWWISQSGSLYNTHQHCSSNCAFNRGSPNEHLYYETPFYNYAVVIDYNTRNAPGGVRAGRGSAFFLHVTDGAPTAGCVSIPQDKLVSLMRWLAPSTHPRILIGVT